SASISAVLPEPTGPPIPMRAMPDARRSPNGSPWWAWVCCMVEALLTSAREQAKFRLLMSHGHDVQKWCATGDLGDVPVGRVAGSLSGHWPHSMQHVLRGAVVDQAQSHRRGDPARAEGIQLADYGGQPRHAQHRADQTKD